MKSEKRQVESNKVTGQQSESKLYDEFDDCIFYAVDADGELMQDVMYDLMLNYLQHPEDLIDIYSYNENTEKNYRKFAALDLPNGQLKKVGDILVNENMKGCSVIVKEFANDKFIEILNDYELNFEILE